MRSNRSIYHSDFNFRDLLSGERNNMTFLGPVKMNRLVNLTTILTVVSVMTSALFNDVNGYVPEYEPQVLQFFRRVSH